jgi:hypothetical protein
VHSRSTGHAVSHGPGIDLLIYRFGRDYPPPISFLRELNDVGFSRPHIHLCRAGCLGNELGRRPASTPPGEWVLTSKSQYQSLLLRLLCRYYYRTCGYSSYGASRRSSRGTANAEQARSYYQLVGNVSLYLYKLAICIILVRICVCIHGCWVVGLNRHGLTGEDVALWHVKQAYSGPSP